MKILIRQLSSEDDDEAKIVLELDTDHFACIPREGDIICWDETIYDVIAVAHHFKPATFNGCTHTQKWVVVVVQ